MFRLSNFKGARGLAAGLAIVAATAQAVTFKDQNGQTVSVPAKVDKVVVIPIPLASLVMAIDQGAGRLGGINAEARDDITHGLLGRLYPAAARIPTAVAGTSFVPNVEALAAANPGLVIQWGDKGDGLIRPIKNLGLPVLTLRYGDSAWVAEWMRLVGKAMGRTERAERLARWYEAGLAEAAKRSAATPDAERPTALYLYRTRSGWLVAGKGTSMDGDIRRAGGRNPAGDTPGFYPVSLEQLLAWDPEVVLLNNFEPGLKPSDIYDDGRLAGLSAIRGKRVYSYPRGGFRWDPPSQETPLSIEWLSALFHPGQPVAGFRQRVKEAYQLLYGYALSPAEIDEILKVGANGRSTGYVALFGECRP